MWATQTPQLSLPGALQSDLSTIIEWIGADSGDRVRTVEAKVAVRVDNIRYGSPGLRLEVIDASGTGACL